MAVLDCIASGTVSDAKMSCYCHCNGIWTWTALILSLCVCTSMQKCGIPCALQKFIHLIRWTKADNSYTTCEAKNDTFHTKIWNQQKKMISRWFCKWSPFSESQVYVDLKIQKPCPQNNLKNKKGVLPPGYPQFDPHLGKLWYFDSK